VASNNWYKKESENKVWWLDNSNEVTGEFIFSFDKKKTYNLFEDYPSKLSKKEREIFDKENPFWADFFSDRG